MSQKKASIYANMTDEQLEQYASSALPIQAQAAREEQARRASQAHEPSPAVKEQLDASVAAARPWTALTQQPPPPAPPASTAPHTVPSSPAAQSVQTGTSVFTTQGVSDQQRQKIEDSNLSREERMFNQFLSERYQIAAENRAAFRKAHQSTDVIGVTLSGFSGSSPMYASRVHKDVPYYLFHGGFSPFEDRGPRLPMMNLDGARQQIYKDSEGKITGAWVPGVGAVGPDSLLTDSRTYESPDGDRTLVTGKGVVSTKRLDPGSTGLNRRGSILMTSYGKDGTPDRFSYHSGEASDRPRYDLSGSAKALERAVGTNVFSPDPKHPGQKPNIEAAMDKMYDIKSPPTQAAKPPEVEAGIVRRPEDYDYGGGDADLHGVY